jgi:hypothetical protein
MPDPLPARCLGRNWLAPEESPFAVTCSVDRLLDGCVPNSKLLISRANRSDATGPSTQKFP